MHTKARKVMIIGAGNVGASAAYALLNQSICEELILVDINQQRAEAQAQDLSDAAAYLPGMMTISTREASDCADVDIAVITVSGGALRPGLVHGLRGDTVGAHGHKPDVRALGAEGSHQLAAQSPALPVNDKHVHAVPQKSISSSRSSARM